MPGAETPRSQRQQRLTKKNTQDRQGKWPSPITLRSILFNKLENKKNRK